MSGGEGAEISGRGWAPGCRFLHGHVRVEVGGKRDAGAGGRPLQGVHKHMQEEVVGSISFEEWDEEDVPVESCSALRYHGGLLRGGAAGNTR